LLKESKAGKNNCWQQHKLYNKHGSPLILLAITHRVKRKE
jgi:hypothetical protein